MWSPELLLGQSFFLNFTGDVKTEMMRRFQLALGTHSRGASSDLLGENYGSATRDHHGVLELGHKAAVVGTERPSIGIIDDKVGRHGQERFNGENHSVVQNHPLTIIKTWHGRLFVKSPADAVPIEIPNHSETVATRVGLNGLADIAKSVARSCRGHRVSLSETSRFQETLRDRWNNSDGSADPSVGKIAVELGGNVDVDQIALAKVASERRNTVSGLVVDTETRGSGKVVGHSRSRSRAVPAKGFSSD
jgi:hypothetical protein